MKWLLVLIVIPILLLIWRVAGDNDKDRERRELMKAIRAELNEVRDDIIKEIKSLK